MLIDSHCHLDFNEFDADREAVMQRAQNQGVGRFVVPGVAKRFWPRQLKLAETQCKCDLAFGIHPWFLDDFDWQDIDELERYLKQQVCVAVGECGVDGAKPDIDLQMKVFMAQIELANQYGKPLIVHHRRSHHFILSAFKQVVPKYGGIIHAFSGGPTDANKYIELGFKLGCGGVITYDRAEKTRRVFKQVGLSHLVLETDSPSMPLAGFQGQRNEPAQLAIVIETLSQLLNVDVDEIGQMTSANTKAVFSLT